MRQSQSKRTEAFQHQNSRCHQNNGPSNRIKGRFKPVIAKSSCVMATNSKL